MGPAGPRACETCGQPLTSRGQKRFCSRLCWGASIRVPSKTCPTCGVQFQTSQPRTYCSQPCSAKARRIGNPRRSRCCMYCGQEIIDGRDSFRFCDQACWTASRQPALSNLTCRQCGATFTAKLDRKFCSRHCSATWAGLTYGPTAGTNRVSKRCAGCGTTFYRPDKKVKYCSRACANRVTQGVKALPHQPCETCGLFFKPRRRGHRFCTKGCAYAARVRTRPPSQPAWSNQERGGLPRDQYALWLALGGRDAGWEPEYWISPMGAVPGVIRMTLDLAHPGKRLVVEVDGPEHASPSRRVRDEARDAWLHGEGWTVLRVSNREVRTAADAVAAKINTN